MKRICLFYLMFCILLTASGCKHRSEPLPGQTTSDSAISAPEGTGPESSAPEEPEPETTSVLGVELTDKLSERERNWLEEYEQFAPYLLHEIVAVNSIDITYVQKKFESVLSPNNSWFSKEHFAYELFIPAFMDWVGCDYKEGYSF